MKQASNIPLMATYTGGSTVSSATNWKQRLSQLVTPEHLTNPDWLLLNRYQVFTDKLPEQSKQLDRWTGDSSRL